MIPVANHHVLIIEKNLCYGCDTCEVACKQEHMLPAGLGFIKVVQKGPERVGGKLRTEYKPSMCMHCEKPPCIEVCATDAIQKRQDGIVLIDEKKCNGCKLCIDACPLKAIEFSDERNLAVKCNLCVDRIDAGLSPSCVHHCPTEAIKLNPSRYRIPQKALEELKKSTRLNLTP